MDDYQLRTEYGAPKGIRIPVPGLKGQCPGPLDDGGITTSKVYQSADRTTTLKDTEAVH